MHGLRTCFRPRLWAQDGAGLCLCPPGPPVPGTEQLHRTRFLDTLPSSPSCSAWSSWFKSNYGNNPQQNQGPPLSQLQVMQEGFRSFIYYTEMVLLSSDPAHSSPAGKVISGISASASGNCRCKCHLPESRVRIKLDYARKVLSVELGTGLCSTNVSY